MERIKDRIKGLENNDFVPEDFTVPGSLEILKHLNSLGVICFLASGTDQEYVFYEASLLGLNSYFNKIFGALDNYKNYSKKMAIDHIINNYNLGGKEFVAFGDGLVEIEDAKSVGRIAVGIASNEATRVGIDHWKRRRLIEASADIIAPDFREYEAILNYLFDLQRRILMP